MALTTLSVHTEVVPEISIQHLPKVASVVLVVRCNGTEVSFFVPQEDEETLRSIMRNPIMRNPINE